MTLLEQDIDMAIRYLSGSHPKDTRYHQSYPFTNEELYLYYPYFALEETSVLTVTGSGDHVLQAIHMGAKDITTFDRNRFAYYVLQLKLAAVQSLNRDEFMSYFPHHEYSTCSLSTLKEEFYKRLRPFLEKDAMFFWDTLYRIDAIEPNFSKFFIASSYLENYGRGSYFNKKNYSTLKDKIRGVSINFIESNLLDLPTKLSKDKKYDTIFLSNIFDWLHFENPDMDESLFEYWFNMELSPFLKDGGKCALFYQLVNDPVPLEFMTPCKRLGKDRHKIYIYTKKGE